MRQARRTYCTAWLLGVLVLPLLLGGCSDTAPTSAVHPQYDATGRATFPIELRSGLPNLAIIVVDTLRHDALPLASDERRDVRMPYLASLASGGVAFSNAVAPAPWTLPSVTSLLTGLQPSAHGLHTPDSQARLLGAITTWAEILGATYDYETIAHTAGPWFSGSTRSVLQGFASTQGGFSLQDPEQRLGPWARMRDPGRPFFLLLHTYDAHAPYGATNHPWRGEALPDVQGDPTVFGPAADPAEIFRRCTVDAGTRIALRDAMGAGPLAEVLQRYAGSGYGASPRPDLSAELEGAYWAGVRWTDGLLARTTAFLDQQGMLDNTLLVVAGDHGEGFGEHGSLSHGRLLHDELVRVPLVMAGPEPFGGGRVVTSSVGLVDVLPTFFDWAGLEPPEDVEGRSALSLLDDDRACRPVISEERLSFLNTGEPQDAIRISVRSEQWKYIVTYEMQTGAVREEAYDLLIDPDEVDDLGEGAGRLPSHLVFDDCFCEAVESVRRRIWSHGDPHVEHASQFAYGTSNRGPTAPPPVPCGTRNE